MSKLSRSLILYTSIILFIVGWWVLAFEEHSSTPFVNTSTSPKTASILSTYYPQISQIDRLSLQDALSGDVALMTQLIADWDIDALLLKSAGLPNAKCLPQNTFLRSQKLGRLLTYGSHEQIDSQNKQHQPSHVTDDVGKKISLQHPYQKFLPQTFTSANFLLALTSPNTIAALPKKMRYQIQLSPKHLTDQVPLDNDRHNAEKIFLKHPEIAFVAHYSQPATIQALASQGLLIYTMRNLSSFEAINAELIQIGQVVGHPLKAELLKIFMEATLLKLDNQLMLFTSLSQHPQVLFLNYYRNFSIPSSKTLTGQLLQRLGNLDVSLKYIQEADKSHEWLVPIDKENILKLNPDLLIIATDSPEALNTEIHNDIAFRQLKAVQNQNLHFVDEATQQSPSQYIVLAYYDLIHTILQAQ